MNGKKAGMRSTVARILEFMIPAVFFSHSFCALRLAPGGNIGEKILGISSGFRDVLGHVFLCLKPVDAAAGMLAAGIFILAVNEKTKKRKKFRQGEEYGSARWGGADDIAPFLDPTDENNIILTATEGLTMESRPKDPKYARNKNVLVIGGSGSGKTRFWLKPNILQNCIAENGRDCRYSLAICDSKGTLIRECGNFLLSQGYTLRVFNTVNFRKSMHYNPFAYIHSEKDILKLVTALINNTQGGEKASDPFWEKAETLLYTALIGYIWSEAVEEEQNFGTLLEFLNAMEVRERSETYKNPVDRLFDDLKETDPSNFAVRQYAKFKLAAAKTMKSILISAAARLAPFDIEEVREIVTYDELELDTLGDGGDDGRRRVALFLIMSDTDPTFNFLLSMIYTQLFNSLCEKADDHYGGRLPVHVRCLIDEAANIGQIPHLEKLVATMRSREISVGLVYQTKSQIKAIYKDNSDTIVGNMDSEIFLGGSEPTTLKELSSSLGKETIDLFTTGENHGHEKSSSLSYQKTGRELATVDELSVLDGDKCILQIRGVRPFLSRKYDIEKHRNYRYLSDFSKSNEFDTEAYLSFDPGLGDDDECELYEITSRE